MQNESFFDPNRTMAPTPTWRDMLSRSAPRPPRSNPGVPNTSPGIPEDQVTHLPPPPQTPPTPGPAIPPPRYEDMLSGWDGEDSGGFTSQYRGGGQRGPSTSPFGAYGNSGEQVGGFFSGLSDYFGGGSGDGGANGWLDDYYNRTTGRGDRGGGGIDTTPPGSAGSGGGLIATGSPYLGRQGMSAADVEFWNLPADYQAAYFERLAMKSVGDYDRSEPTLDSFGNVIDPGGEIISGPKTTAIRQLMSDMAQTARSQMLSGYMPRVSY